MINIALVGLVILIFIISLLPNNSGRIVEKEINGKISYTVEQRHFIFRFWWVDAWVNSLDGACFTDTFDNKPEAQQLLDFLQGKGFNCIK